MIICTIFCNNVSQRQRWRC